MKRNVLIFGGGSYAATQIYQSLKNNLLFKPILASSYDNHSTFISEEAIIDLPYTSDQNFVDKFNECIEKNNVEFVIPTHDSTALTLMENEKRIKATIVCSPLETAKICRYKSKTYKVLGDFDFIPKVYDMDADIEYPVFAKNDVGQGSRDSYLITCESDLEKIKNSNINFVLCEYLPGEEITVDCFTNRKQELLFVQPRLRSRTLNGISSRAQTIPLTQEIKNIALAISEKIKFRGYWFFQLKKDKNGKYKLLEISTRFAGTFVVSKSLDVNLPLLALCDFANIDVSITPNTYQVSADKSYIDRFKLDITYDRVYIDFDDTLVFDCKNYNTQMMMFIYQCINENKELILITKHKYDIYKTMERIRLNPNLFDEIIVVPVEDEKFKYMDNSKKSIFIDNAYNERKSVKYHLGMPTFDVSNVDCLIDWRKV